MTLTPWVPEVFPMFCKKSPLFNQFFSLFFCDPFYLSMAWFLVSALSLWYFLPLAILYETQWGKYLSCTAREMILAMLSSLLWARSLIKLCFSFFTVKVLNDFRVTTIARERSRLAPLKVVSTGRPTLLANAAMEIPPVITVDVIRPVSWYLGL